MVAALLFIHAPVQDMRLFPGNRCYGCFSKENRPDGWVIDMVGLLSLAGDG